MVWLLIAIRKLVSGCVSSLLMISAVVLTIQTAVALTTGYMWMFQLQFPLANLAMCVVFARTAPTHKPLVAQLATEVVALKQPHHPGLPPGPAAPLLRGRLRLSSRAGALPGVVPDICGKAS